jgi:peptidyl-prolyl cis-trans isomerase D
VEHKPVTRKPFEEVRALIQEAVVQQEAAALAKKTGEAKLAAVRSSGDAGGFDAPVVISRTKAPQFSEAAVTTVMKADASKLPAYVGVDIGRAGYAVYRINKVSQPQNADAARRDNDRKQLGSLLAQREMASYIDSLKKKAKVEIHTSFDKVVSDGGV